MFSFRPALAAALVAGLALGPFGLTACAPQTDPPVPVMVIDYTDNGLWEPTEVELTTIRDLPAMKGDAANFIGGARIVIDPGDPLCQAASCTNAQLREIALKQRGGDVRGNFIAHDGVLWPVDFHTWSMVTGYFNFERAFNYFIDTGLVEPEEVFSPDVFYFPYYIDAYQFPGQQFDNLLWDWLMFGFIVQPTQNLQAQPPIVSRGAIAHEFSHLVFTVRGGNELYRALQLWRQSSALGSLISGYKILRSLDEGFADYHAVQSLCHPGNNEPECGNTLFLAPILGEELARARDISRDGNCLTAGARIALDGSSLQDTGSSSLWYTVGTAVATSLYIAGRDNGQHSTLVEALLRSYSDQNADPNLIGLRQLIGRKIENGESTFTIGEALTPLITHLPEGDLKEDVCGQLMERLRMQDSELTVCNSPARPEVCPE